MDDVYLIWSHEHRAWWGPGECGYVASIGAAGRYSRAKALMICIQAVPGTAAQLGALPELPVREADLLELHKIYRSLLPALPPEPWEPAVCRSGQ
jgi:hypothetical protein